MFRNRLKALTKQLYPTGRAFNIFPNSEIEKINDGLILSENRFHEDARGVLSVILPDNADFTIEDAARWEQYYGLITNDSVSLEDRKAAIIRKMNHPGNIPARQSADYIQSQLQLAGFNVFVHENIPETEILSLNAVMDIVQFGQYQFGNVQFGQKFYSNKVANNIEQSKDLYFLIGNENKSIFFVGGETLPNFADIDVNRKDEFRQLILKLKPVQTVGYLLINYV